MIDQSSVNLLDLVGSTTSLRRVASTEGGEYKGPCPFCGGDDRFTVQPDYSGGGRWFCRTCTPDWTDAIAFWRKLHPGMAFNEALQQLGLQTDITSRFSRSDNRNRQSRQSSAFNPRQQTTSPPDAAWQQAARTFSMYCADLLWSQSGSEGKNYLEKRGLTNREILEAAGIGYNPQDYNGIWGSEEVYLPRGITIPWIIDEQIWGVNARDMDWTEGKGDKYRRAKGSQNAIYRIQHVSLGSSVLMVETEFDALVLQQVLCDVNLNVVPIATGSISWGRPLQWLGRVAVCDRALIAFDLETKPEKIESVERAAAWWLNALKPKASRLLPTRHDITDMLLAGDDILNWIKTAFE